MDISCLSRISDDNKEIVPVYSLSREESISIYDRLSSHSQVYVCNLTSSPDSEVKGVIDQDLTDQGLSFHSNIMSDGDILYVNDEIE